MSVIIRGMKMPETCDKCDFCIWSNYRQTAWCRREKRQCFDDYSVEYREKRAEFCPMSELPAQHGRLIDADKITLTDIDLALCEDYKSLLSLYINKVESAQTVIEAEVTE